MSAALERSADEHLALSEWLDLDVVFHRGVARASHNPVLAMPLTAVHAVAQPRLNRLIADQLDRTEIFAQHMVIYQAIADGIRTPLPGRCRNMSPTWKPATPVSPADHGHPLPSWPSR